MSQKKHIADFVRMPKTVQVPLADIKFDETGPEDETFTKLYVRYLTGKLIDIRTRVDIRTIIPGFFRINEKGIYENIGLQYDARYLESEILNIQLGFRPSLFLYKAFTGPAQDKLICSGELLPFYAYKKLGIRYVPAVIRGKHPELLQESGICTRGDAKMRSSTFDSLLVHKHALVPSLAGDPDDFEKRDPKDIVDSLILHIRSTMRAVSAFHRPSSDERIHYHHTLHSVLCSLDQVLSAVGLLISNGLERQIRPLARSAYDLFLNFYIDWLYPEKMGALFQALAILSRTEKSRAEYKSLDNAIRKTFGGLVDVLMNQAEKGRVSPLGSKAHNAIYSELSPAVHQDFGVTQEFGDSLESGVVEPMSRSELAQILQYLNVVVSSTIVRIADDVGAGKGVEA